MNEPAKGPALLRQYNERHVLSYLRRARISTRLDIARALSLSKNTISLIVDDFIAQGMLEEIGVQPSGGLGRPKIQIALVPDKLKAAGIMIEHGRMHWLVANYFCERIESQHLELDTTEPAQVLAAIAAAAAGLVQRHPELIGIGVGFPGIIDPLRGEIHVSSRLGWQHVALQPTLDAAVPVPVGIMNTVKAAALVAGRDESLNGHDGPCFYLRIAEGIGGTLLTRQGVYYGGSWTAGEVGHLIVAADGPVCSCGQRGCLESKIGLPAINAQLGSQRPGLSWANHSEAVAITDAVLAPAGALLGKALSQIIHLINPATLLIDCPYASSSLFTEQVLTAARQATLPFAYSHTRIRFLADSFDPALGLALGMIQRYEQITL